MSPDGLRHKPKYQILRSLLCGTVSSEEVMRAYDIFPYKARLGGEVAASVGVPYFGGVNFIKPVYLADF